MARTVEPVCLVLPDREPALNGSIFVSVGRTSRWAGLAGTDEDHNTNIRAMAVAMTPPCLSIAPTLNDKPHRQEQAPRPDPARSDD